jgi:hypothetical protein
MIALLIDNNTTKNTQEITLSESDDSGKEGSDDDGEAEGAPSYFASFARVALAPQTDRCCASLERVDFEGDENEGDFKRLDEMFDELDENEDDEDEARPTQSSSTISLRFVSCAALSRR